jgi:hypothetical protein
MYAPVKAQTVRFAQAPIRPDQKDGGRNQMHHVAKFYWSIAPGIAVEDELNTSTSFNNKLRVILPLCPRVYASTQIWHIELSLHNETREDAF